MLSSHDKNHCTTDHDAINKGIEKGLEKITVELKVEEYRTFYDCLRWYSAHPTTSIKK